MKQKFKEKDHAKLNKALDRLNAVGSTPASGSTEESGIEPSPPALAEVSRDVAPVESPGPTAKKHRDMNLSDTPEEQKKRFER